MSPDYTEQRARLRTLLHTIRDGLHRSLPDSLQLAGSKLPDVQVNDGDVKAAALYLRDLGLPHDGLRLHGEFARLQNRCMNEWLASTADGESQEYRDRLTELYGPFPSQGNPNDSVVVDRRVTIVGLVVQLSEFVDELISTVTEQGEGEGEGDKPPAATPGTEQDEGEGERMRSEKLSAPGGGTPPIDETNRYAALDKLPDAPRNAYLSFLYAEAKNERRLGDREAWEWLQENGTDGAGAADLDGYDLPEFGNWARYLRRARKVTGEQKYTPRTK